MITVKSSNSLNFNEKQFAKLPSMSDNRQNNYKMTGARVNGIIMHSVLKTT